MAQIGAHRVTREPWKETEEMFAKRLQGIAQHINDNCDVEGLCRRIHSCAQKVVDNEGGRINTTV